MARYIRRKGRRTPKRKRRGGCECSGGGPKWDKVKTAVKYGVPLGLAAFGAYNAFGPARGAYRRSNGDPGMMNNMKSYKDSLGRGFLNDFRKKRYVINLPWKRKTGGAKRYINYKVSYRGGRRS